MTEKVKMIYYHKLSHNPENLLSIDVNHPKRDHWLIFHVDKSSNTHELLSNYSYLKYQRDIIDVA